MGQIEFVSEFVKAISDRRAMHSALEATTRSFLNFNTYGGDA